MFGYDIKTMLSKLKVDWCTFEIQLTSIKITYTE